MRPKSACKAKKRWIATEYVTGGSVIGGQGRNECGEAHGRHRITEITSLMGQQRISSPPKTTVAVSHAYHPSGHLTRLWECLLHPNALLSSSPDSVKFVSVVLSVTHVDPMDIVGMNQEPGIQMCSKKESKYKAEDPVTPHSPEP